MATMKRRITKAVKDARDSRDLADSLLDLLEGADRDEIEDAADVIAELIFERSEGVDVDLDAA